jgi:hypothetical protein
MRSICSASVRGTPGAGARPGRADEAASSSWTVCSSAAPSDSYAADGWTRPARPRRRAGQRPWLRSHLRQDTWGPVGIAKCLQVPLVPVGSIMQPCDDAVSRCPAAHAPRRRRR